MLFRSGGLIIASVALNPETLFTLEGSNDPDDKRTVEEENDDGSIDNEIADKSSGGPTTCICISAILLYSPLVFSTLLNLLLDTAFY